MSRNDITMASPQRFGVVRRHQVASGSAASIKAGEAVKKTLGSQYVALATDENFVVATDYIVGIAASDSTDTAAAAGVVDVIELDPRDDWFVAWKAAGTDWDTQAHYDGHIGDRVVIDVTAGVFTALAADGATNGCVVLPNDLTVNPGKVRFAFRAGLSYLA